MLAHGTAIDLCAVVIFSDGQPWTDDDLVKVLVRSSFAAHLAQWLLLTAPEYV